MTVLGPERPNPYTTENMMAAFEELRASGVEPPEGFQVRTTHRYVRYRPERWEQYMQLHMDTRHIFFDHPLDREVVTPGNRYHDPEIPADRPEYQYAALEDGFELENGIPYDILAELYLPELDTRIEDREFCEVLVGQAFDRLGVPQDDEVDEGRAGSAKASWYTPAGQVLIFDDRLAQNIGLEGVLVTARRWFVVFWGRADHSGNYQVNGAFKRPCNYRVHYEAPGFNVRENVLNLVAYVDGPKQTGNWNTVIGAGSYNNFAGTVFRGAYYYHYKSIDGLLRPFNPNGQFTSYIAKNAVSTGSIGFSPSVVPLIFIWRQYSGGTNLTTDAVFSTTIHETAHLTHYILLGMNASAWALTFATRIGESWPVGVEWYLTSKEYRSRGITNYGRETDSVSGYRPASYGYQGWNAAGNAGDYTNLFIDCMDYCNELGQSFGGQVGTVDDRIGQWSNVGGYWQTTVAAYSISTLETHVVKHSLNMNALCVKLKDHKPWNVTNSDIDLLLSYY